MQCTVEEMNQYYGLDDEPTAPECPCCVELSARLDTYDAALTEFDDVLQDHERRLLALEDAPTEPPAPITWTDYIVKASTNLAFRAEPNTHPDTEIIDRIPYGETIPVDEASAVPDETGNGEWVQCQWSDTIGWVAKWWLKKK